MDSRPSRRSTSFISLLILTLTSVILAQGCSTLEKAFQVHRLEPATISDSPVLIRAIRLEDWKKADSLVASGTGLGDHGFDGSSALSLAAKAGREPLVRAIVATKTPTPFDGELALIEAAAAGHKAVVDFLIDSGFKAGSAKGYDILVHKRSVEALRLLLRAPDPSFKVSFKTGTGVGPVLPWAAATGDADLVKEFLRQGAKPDQSSDQVLSFVSGTSALWVAAFFNSEEVVRLLLAAGAKIEKGDYWYEFTPLMAAAMSGSVESARALVESGAKIAAKSKTARIEDFKVTLYGSGESKYSWTDVDLKQRTALMLAAEHGRADMVRYLVSAGAEVDAKNDDGITAHDAARAANHPEIAELLRSLGSGGKAASAPAEAPIVSAVFAYLPEVVEQLLPRLEEAYTGKQLIEPLTAAVLALRSAERVEDKTTQFLLSKRAHESLVILLKARDRISEFDQYGALLYAAYSPALLVELVDSGVKADADTMFRTACTLAELGAEPQFLKCVEAMGKPMKDDQLTKALFYAAYGGNTAIIGRLIDLGAKPNPGNFWVKNFGTPLGAAAFNGKIEAMRFLQGKGAELDPKLASPKWGALPEVNPLMDASLGGSLAAVKYLVSAGVSLDGISFRGRTALSYAAVEGHADVVRFLLESGADPNTRMNALGAAVFEMRGETALMQAARAGKLESVKALLAKGADPRLTDWNGDDAYLMAYEAGWKDVAAALRTALGDPYR